VIGRSGISPERIVLVAGGTGGHIVPALAFGTGMAVCDSRVDLKYVSGGRDLESEIYSSYGIEPLALPLKGSPAWGGFVTRISRTWSILVSFFIMLRFFVRWKPHACVLFGGYVSFPALAACLILSVPVLVHEQNAKAGKITRIASFFRKPVCSGWKTCEPLKKRCFEHTGVPVRIFGNLLPEEAWIKLEYGTECPGSPRILVLGGSLASDKLAKLAMGVSRIDEFGEWTFLFPGASDIWKRESANCWLGPRMWEMDALFSLADIVITRCGASTLAEIASLGIPAILVPWPDAADDHQTANARAFSEICGAPIVNEKEISAGLLGETLLAVYYSGKNEQAVICTGKNSADKAVMKLWNAIRHITEGRDRN